MDSKDEWHVHGGGGGGDTAIGSSCALGLLPKLFLIQGFPLEFEVSNNLASALGMSVQFALQRL